MSKKKVLCYVIYFFLLVYVGTILIGYFISRTTMIQNFEYECNDTRSSLEKRIEANDFDEDYVEDMVRNLGVNYSTYGKYGYRFFLTDQKANIIARSGPFIEIIGSYDDYCGCGLQAIMSDKNKSDSQSAPDIDIETHVDLNGKIPEEVRSLLTDQNIVNQYQLSDTIRVTRMDYRIDNNELIPVTLWIQGGGKRVNGQHIDSDVMEIKMNDLEPTTTCISSSNNGILVELLLDHENINYNVPQSNETSQRFNEEWEIQFQGNYYALIYTNKQDLPYQTLHSTIFHSIVASETILMLPLLILSLFLANYIYNKNKMLNEARVAFTNATAHELKTPLAIISNQCECIMENVAPDKNQEYVASIYEEVKKMDQTVLSFLHYNRLTRLNKISKEPINISNLVNNMLTQYTYVFDERGLAIHHEIESDIWINANEELFATAIDQYFSNAAKYAVDDGTPVEISLRKKRIGFHFEIINSCDMNSFPWEIDLWNLLIRGDASRNREAGSTGMGLTTCAQIFKLHHFKYGTKIVGTSRIMFYIEGGKR